jgi:hypothetical protein
LDHQEDIERRLLEHELKRERYLEFKKELDSLKNVRYTIVVNNLSRMINLRQIKS